HKTICAFVVTGTLWNFSCVLPTILWFISIDNTAISTPYLSLFHHFFHYISFIFFFNFCFPLDHALPLWVVYLFQLAHHTEYRIKGSIIMDQPGSGLFRSYVPYT